MDTAEPPLSNTRRKKLTAAGWVHQKRTTDGTQGTGDLEILSRKSTDGVQFLILPAMLLLTADGAINKLKLIAPLLIAATISTICHLSPQDARHGRPINRNRVTGSEIGVDVKRRRQRCAPFSF